MNSDTPFFSSPAPFPVRGTVAAALRMARSEWFALLQILLIPSFILALIATFLKTGVTPQNPQGMNFTYGIVSIFVQPLLAVTVLRYLVLGEKKSEWLPAYQPRMWRYMFRQFIVGAIIITPTLLAAVPLLRDLPKMQATAAIMLIVSVLTLLTTRFTLVVPASALGGDDHFKTSWQLTQGQIWRIILFRFLIALLSIVPFVVTGVLGTGINSLAPPVANIFTVTFVTLLQISVMQIMDALIYAHFMPLRENHYGA